MADNTSIFKRLCHMLGAQGQVTYKAVELYELLEARVGTTSLAALRLTGSCKHVICVDLAARALGSTLNKSDVIKLSGMTKKSYSEAVKVIASMLDLEERVTLRELAVQFGCTGAVALATETLHRYISDQCSNVDFSAPMFLCSALIVACRKLKIKLDRAKLREWSGTKKITLDRLIAQMEKYVEKTASKEKQTPSKRSASLMEVVEAHIQEEDEAAKSTKRPRQEEEPSDDNNRGKTSAVDYEEWKRKILAKAAQTTS